MNANEPSRERAYERHVTLDELADNMRVKEGIYEDSTNQMPPGVRWYRNLRTATYCPQEHIEPVIHLLSESRP